MNVFWEFVLTLTPSTVAPNTITLAGVVINFAMYFLMFYYDQTLGQPVPEWTYLWFAIGLFIYQTLDALDGKQARKTGSGSPLGQLFDHGCDAFSCSLVALALSHTLQLGITWKSKLLISSLWAPFYLAQLLEYHVGHIRTQIGNIGVTEGQFGQIGVMIASFLLGATVYQNKVTAVFTFLSGVVPDYLELRDIVILVLVVNSLGFGAFLFVEIILSGKGFSGKIMAFMRTIPIWITIGCFWMLDSNDIHTINNAALIVFAFGLIFTIITTKVIITTMAKMDYSFIQFETILMAPYVLIQNYCFCSSKALYEKAAFIIGSLLIAMLYIKFVRTWIVQITSKLGIYCFSIQKPKKQ